MDSKYYGKLSVIGMKGSEDFLAQVDDYIHEWRGDQDETYIVKADCPRFGTGEGKGIILETDIFNSYGTVTSPWASETTFKLSREKLIKKQPRNP